MPLQRLDAGVNPISSVEALRGMPLEFLRARCNEDRGSLSAARNAAAVLGLYNCGNLRDLSPLLDLGTLEILSISEHGTDLSRLKALPGLILVTSEQSLPFGGDSKLRETWREPDHASRFPGKK